MNGSSINNTISPKQLRYLVDTINQISENTLRCNDEACNSFLSAVSQAWAGNDAKEAAADFASSFNGFIDEYKNMHANIVDGIVEIANSYAKKARKPLMMYSGALNFKSNINYMIISDCFTGTDEYGFREYNPNKLQEGLDKFKKIFDSRGIEILNAIKTVNAFGNPEIRNYIYKYGDNAFQLLKDYYNKISEIVINKINDENKKITSALPEVLGSAFSTVRSNSSNGTYRANRSNESTTFNADKLNSYVSPAESKVYNVTSLGDKK